MITFLKTADSPPRSCPDQCARKRRKKILRPLAKPLLLSRRAFQELSGLSVSGRCGLETRNSTASLEPIRHCMHRMYWVVLEPTWKILNAIHMTSIWSYPCWELDPSSAVHQPLEQFDKPRRLLTSLMVSCIQA